MRDLRVGVEREDVRVVGEVPRVPTAGVGVPDAPRGVANRDAPDSIEHGDAEVEGHAFAILDDVPPDQVPVDALVDVDALVYVVVD